MPRVPDMSPAEMAKRVKKAPPPAPAASTKTKAKPAAKTKAAKKK